MTAGTWIGITALGGAGALARFLVDGVVSLRAGRDFPLGTLAVNVSGALVLGVLAGITLSGSAAVLAGTATVGSYSTFSTWMLETQRLAEQGEPLGAAWNIVFSLAAGLAAVAVGRSVGGWL
jgi:CrcB protein